MSFSSESCIIYPLTQIKKEESHKNSSQISSLKLIPSIKPEVRIKKRAIFLIDRCCSYSIQIILAGSTTYCCFQVTLFQYLQQNSALWKIKLQIKLYKLGEKPHRVLCHKVLCFIQTSRLTFLLCHCHSMGTAAALKGCSRSADAVRVASIGLQLPKQGQWLPMEQCVTTVPISSPTYNDQIHESRSSHFGLLGFIWYHPQKRNLFLVKILFNTQCIKK